MYFKREPPKAKIEDIPLDAFWLRDDKDQVISFRDKEAAEHFRQMVEESEAYLRIIPSFHPATLQAHLCEFDNNGFVIQLTVSPARVPQSGIIELLPAHDD